MVLKPPCRVQVVVNMHRPIYTSSASGLDPSSVIRVSEDLRGALEPVFFMYQVSACRSHTCSVCQGAAYPAEEELIFCRWT